MKVIYELSISGTQWFAYIEGHKEYGRGRTKEDALLDLITTYPSLFNINQFDIHVTKPEQYPRPAIPTV